MQPTKNIFSVPKMNTIMAHDCSVYFFEAYYLKHPIALANTFLRWHQQKEFMKTGWLYFNKEPRVKGSIKKSFLIVVYSNCYSLIWYLIFFYMLRYFVIIFLPSFVSCAYTTYILLFYFMCVSNELVFNFDNIFFFYVQASGTFGFHV